MPRYLVEAPIVRDGHKFVPGDYINVSREQAKQWHLNKNYCVRITDEKLLQEIWDEQERRQEEDRENRLYDAADKLGVERRVVKRGLLD